MILCSGVIDLLLPDRAGLATKTPSHQSAQRNLCGTLVASRLCGEILLHTRWLALGIGAVQPLAGFGNSHPASAHGWASQSDARLIRPFYLNTSTRPSE